MCIIDRRTLFANITFYTDRVVPPFTGIYEEINLISPIFQYFSKIVLND